MGRTSAQVRPLGSIESLWGSIPKLPTRCCDSSRLRQLISDATRLVRTSRVAECLSALTGGGAAAKRQPGEASTNKASMLQDPRHLPHARINCLS